MVLARLKYPGNWNPEPGAWLRFSRKLQWDTGAALGYGALGIAAAMAGGWLPARQAARLPLAQTLKGLGTALLDDITHEERELLTPEIIRDDGIVVDQCGG